MKYIKSQPFKRKRKNEKRKTGYLLLPIISPSQPIFPFVPSLPSFSTCSLPLSAPLFPFFPLFSSIAERLLLRLLLQLCLVLSSPDFSILISTLLDRLVDCVSCSHLHTPPYSDLHSSSTVGSSFLFFPLFIQGVSRAKFITSPPSQSQPSLNLHSQSHHLPKPTSNNSGINSKPT